MCERRLHLLVQQISLQKWGWGSLCGFYVGTDHIGCNYGIMIITLNQYNIFNLNKTNIDTTFSELSLAESCKFSEMRNPSFSTMPFSKTMPRSTLLHIGIRPGYTSDSIDIT